MTKEKWIGRWCFYCGTTTRFMFGATIGVYNEVYLGYFMFGIGKL